MQATIMDHCNLAVNLENLIKKHKQCKQNEVVHHSVEIPWLSDLWGEYINGKFLQNF